MATSQLGKNCQRALAWRLSLSSYCTLCKRSNTSLSRKCTAPEAIARIHDANYSTSPEPNIVADKKPFNKILIANRGEIACRVMKTCKKLGIKTVAVYSEADENAVHVAMADEAVLIGPPQSADSYLKIDNVIEACKKTGAQAVHPGYGFLSENHVFGEKLAENGITFIGPEAYALQSMGDKIESKKIGKKANVSIIPGFDGVVKDPDHAVSISKEIGYPVMIKASAGGGGKGMRIAYNDDEVREGYRFSSQEAKSSFGDDRLLVEKFIEDPRHIEIQVIGDKHGNVIHLNERECSIQRRNQKVIEEAPSPFLDAETRQAMGSQAVMLAKEVGYSSAGTVEFLIDKHKKFYFLEMNTRLQVEHPITELTTGFDLVELMINSAAGLPLPITQEDVPLKGWAVECRVYAEDPTKNFGLPSTGRLSQYIEPLHIPNVRCDSGVREGSEISIYYDSMICKLVTYGKTRQEALDTMQKALDSYVIRGLTNNISLLRDVIINQKFVDGNISTKFLGQEYPDGFKGKSLNILERNELIAASCHRYIQKEKRAGQFLNQNRLMCPKNNADNKWELVVEIEDNKIPVTVDVNDKDIEVNIEGEKMRISSSSPLSSSILETSINDRPVVFQTYTKKDQTFKLIHYGTAFDVKVLSKRQMEMTKYMPEKPTEDFTPFLKSPMPGTLISIKCNVGDTVIEGQEVAVVEAMKMQNSLHIQKTGKVKAIHYKAGESIAENDTILELE